MVAFLTRRRWLASALTVMTLGGSRLAMGNALYGGEDEEYFDPALLPPAESEIDFPIDKVNLRSIPKRFRRQIVDFEGTEALGTIIVEPENGFLDYVIEQGQVIRYGVGVGRAGFAWSGNAIVGMKRRWPRWVPPRSMVYPSAGSGIRLTRVG